MTDTIPETSGRIAKSQWRCKLSALAIEAMPKAIASRKGIAWRNKQNARLVRVRWDGTKVAQTYDATFIEPTPED